MSSARKCLWCKKAIKNKNTLVRYCCSECRTDASTERRKEALKQVVRPVRHLHCPNCDCSFQTEDSLVRYCSEDCVRQMATKKLNSKWLAREYKAPPPGDSAKVAYAFFRKGSRLSLKQYNSVRG